MTSGWPVMSIQANHQQTTLVGVYHIRALYLLKAYSILSENRDILMLIYFSLFFLESSMTGSRLIGQGLIAYSSIVWITKLTSHLLPNQAHCYGILPHHSAPPASTPTVNPRRTSFRIHLQPIKLSSQYMMSHWFTTLMLEFRSLRLP
jgi:hypothetical protein